MTVGVWKIPVRDDPGDVDQYGTDDVELLMRLVAGELTGVQPPIVKIKSEQGWEFYPTTSPFWIRDSDATHTFRILTENLGGNYTLTIPTIAANSKFVINSIINAFSDEQKFDDIIKVKPIAVPSLDAAYGQIVADTNDSNKLKYIDPAGNVIDLTGAFSNGAPPTATYVTMSSNSTLTVERLLASGDGVAIVDGGAGNNVTPNIDVIDLARKRITFIDDCFGENGKSDVFIPETSGSGAAVTNLAVTETGVFGVWQIETGTTSSGRAGIRAGNLSSFCLGQGVSILEFKIKVPTLSTSLEEYILRIGFGDVVIGAPTDSVLFRYDRVTTTNWQIQTKNNGIETLVNTATAVGTGWVRLKIVVNAAGTEARFYVNGTEVSGSPISTNIPTGSSRQLTVIASIDKDVGSTSRTILTDYSALDIKLSSPR